MSAKELAQEAMALPLAERVALAQTLWQSIGGQSADSVNTEVQWAVEEAAKRDAELSSGAVSGRTHEQVMRAARKAIE
jgi:putative addiction module component (TIGR02574 family)